MSGDHVGAFRDRASFIVLPKRISELGVGAAVRAYCVAPRLDTIDDVGIVLAYEAIEQDRRGKVQLVQHAEHPPNSDPQPVVAPRVVTLRLRTRGPVEWIVADTCHKGKMFDVKTDIEGEPLAGGPVIEWPFLYRRVAIAAVAG